MNDDGQDATVDESVTDAVPDERTWLDSLADDERGFVRNKGWSSPTDLLKSYRHLERKIGADAVRIPGPAAEPSDVAAFWSRLGHPESPEGYALPAPEDVPGYSDDMAAWFRQAAHAVHMPAEMAQLLHDRYVERFLQDARDADGEAYRRMQESEAELKAEWGAAFEHRRQLANRAIRALGGGPLFEELEASGMANSAALARAFAVVGEKLYAEDRFVEGGRTADFLPSPDAARQEIQRLRADGSFMAAYGDRRHPDHDAAQTRMDRLYDAASGTD